MARRETRAHVSTGTKQFARRTNEDCKFSVCFTRALFFFFAFLFIAGNRRLYADTGTRRRHWTQPHVVSCSVIARTVIGRDSTPPHMEQKSVKSPVTSRRDLRAAAYVFFQETNFQKCADTYRCFFPPQRYGIIVYRHVHILPSRTDFILNTL